MRGEYGRASQDERQAVGDRIRGPSPQARRLPSLRQHATMVERLARAGGDPMRRGAARFLPAIRVRRVRCAHCRHDWILRPTRFVPRAHYQPCVVACGVAMWLRGLTFEAIASALSCSARTVGRWLLRLADPSALGTCPSWSRFASRIANRLRSHVRDLARLPVVAGCASN